MNQDNQNKQKVQKTLNNQNDANEPITFLPQHGHYHPLSEHFKASPSAPSLLFLRKILASFARICKNLQEFNFFIVPLQFEK